MWKECKNNALSRTSRNHSYNKMLSVRANNTGHLGARTWHSQNTMYSFMPRPLGQLCIWFALDNQWKKLDRENRRGYYEWTTQGHMQYWTQDTEQIQQNNKKKNSNMNPPKKPRWTEFRSSRAVSVSCKKIMKISRG